MRYNQLIASSPKVSEIGMGTWQLGIQSGWKNLNEKEAIHLVHRALEGGINFFDTAPNYGLGSSEQRLGKALKETDRSSVVINTKFGHTHTGELNYESSYLRESLEGSLKRLQTDYVDSLILHNLPKAYLDGSQTDHFEILEDLKKEGKIRAYGASVDTFDEMKLLMDTTDSTVIEAFFNILHQDTARAFEQAKQQGVGIIAKIPLDSGWLSGKYDAESTFSGIRARWSPEEIQNRAWLVKRVNEIIGEERNLVQTALSFCAFYEPIATVIPGSTDVSQLNHNIKSVQESLPEELVERLEQFYREEVEPLGLPW